MSKSVFECQNCAAVYPKWQGQCEQCGEWGTLEETVVLDGKNKKTVVAEFKNSKKVILFSQVKALKSQKSRFSTNIGELDRCLGGGLVPGMVILLGGEPGIGKSTLLTHLVVEQLFGSSIKKQKIPKKILYLAGEESPQQISLRIERLSKQINKNNQKIAKNKLDKLSFCTSTDVDELVGIISQQKPELAIIDSIQTLTTNDLSGSAGSAGQLREATDRLTSLAKTLHIPMFFVGHVTKDGNIAGPKILEHIVDTVLELSGERTDELRLLRTLKNRFGSTDEVGVFRVCDYGLEEVSNPSQIFLENSQKNTPGNTTVCVMEGSRPLLVEVQALVVKSQLAMPRRVGRGIELSRIQVLSAILQKHCGLPLEFHDLFLSVAGGFKLKEPSIDLGLAVAMASSLKNKPVDQAKVFVGEVGLLGEVRNVNYHQRRVKEAERLGFESVVSSKKYATVKEVLKELNLL